MKGKILKGGVGVVTLMLTMLFIYNRTIGKIPRYITKAIKDTYENEEKFENSSLNHSMLCDAVSNNYKETIKNISLENANIQDEGLNLALEKYTQGIEIRSKAYEAYKINDLDNFEKLLKESDEFINPALTTLVEEYNLDIKDMEQYKFIKSKVVE